MLYQEIRQSLNSLINLEIKRMANSLPLFAFYFHTVLPHGADQIGNTSGIDTLIQ
jgi:hypothetical protein